MEQILINIGLAPLQAQAYLFLLENGTSPPKELISELNITRTNAYKVLESLEEIGLVIKSENNNKIVYSSADPSALASIVAEKRNNILALEYNVNQAMQQLRSTYGKQNSAIKVSVKSGKQSIIDAYMDQSNQKESIYFYKTRADIPFMGFEIMSKIRNSQGKLAPKRYGITPDAPEGNLSKDLDKGANLERTWIDDSFYTAPVEWSVSGSLLVIQVFDDKGASVIIENDSIATAFKQIWKLSNNAIRDNPSYGSKPIKAKRLI